MHFGENQLSRSLIGLSPLPTTHPLSLQPKWVRASTTSYCCFTLAMGRSLRFGSRTHHYTKHYCLDTPYSDSLSLRLPLPGYFSPFPHGTNPPSVTGKYSGLPGGPGRFTADSTGPLLLGEQSHSRQHVFVYGALTLYGQTI